MKNSIIHTGLCNVYKDGVVREVNARALGKGLELLSVNIGRFEINQVLFSSSSCSSSRTDRWVLQMIQH